MSINMFQLLADNIIEPLWIMNLDLEIIYANKEYIKIHSGKIEEVIGLDTKIIYSSELLQDYIDQCKMVSETLSVLTKREYINNLYRERTIIPLLDKDGNLEALCGMYKEVFNLDKKHKDILKSLVEAFPGHIFYKNETGKYIYANDKCIEYYKHKGIENLIGKSDEELLNSSSIIKSKSNLSDDKCNIYKYKCEEDNYFEIIEKNIIEDDNLVGTVGFALDITEKIQTEERLKEISYRDTLTGTYNRTCFQKVCEEYEESPKEIGIIMGDVNGLKIVNDSLGHSEGDNYLKEISKILLDSVKGRGLVFRIGGDEFVIIIENAKDEECLSIISEITDRCKSFKHKFINISISLGYSLTNRINRDILSVIREAENHVYKGKLRKEKSIKNSIVYSTVEKLNMRNIEKYDHIERMIENAIYIGERLNLNEIEMEELVLTSKLHDIGKIGIDEEILLKSNKLTKVELDIAQNHAEKGYRILKAADVLNNVSRSVLTHHERWDGKGYPLGLKDTDIPIVARIISVVDSYDVMINGSSYKAPMTEEEAIQELRNCAGTQFDPEIVEIFINHINRA